ncbi:MAG: response regulator [Halobacteriaceae archaeon]
MDDIRVLHLDADEGFLEATVSYFEERGITVVPEADPGAALDRLAGDSFDCVVCDHRPGFDGLAVLRRVREEYPDLPVVLFTGEGSESLAGEAIAAGVTGYLRKDGEDSLGVLADRIREAVAR